METRARYVLIGLFTLGVILVGFGFVYWMQGTAGFRERSLYRVRFESPVSGLLQGSAVLFNGVRVGEVTGLQLSPDDPRQVTATIAVDSGTKVHKDTRVGLDFGGLIGGTAAITLTGGTPTSPIVTGPAGEPPLLVADADAGQTITQLGREVLRRIDTILAENSDSLHSALANLDTFSQALARNSNRIDGLLGGLERMTGGGAPAKPPPTYDLTAPGTFPALSAKAPRGQLAIPEPTSTLMFETQKIMVRGGDNENSPLEGVQWSDGIPKLFQEKIIQSFENSKFLRAVARQVEGFNADYQLLIDIRNFQILASAQPMADVEFAAKILGNNGRIVDARIFHATAPAKAMDAPAAAAALNEAFGKVVTDLVVWTSGVI